MYAVIRSGGKQIRVAPGADVRVEKIAGEVGAEVRFDQVLLIGGGEGEAAALQIGRPLLAGASVAATITAQGRGEKLVVFKMKRRKNYRRKQGHRQAYTQVRIDAINADAGAAAAQ